METLLCTCFARSSAEEFDARSLVFDGPRFTFLQAQEFFISPDASCKTPLSGVEPLQVPVDRAAKEAQLQQRFMVKHIKESLVAASKQDVSKAKEVGQTFMSRIARQEPVPLVELHLFPGSAWAVNSTWRALLVPRVRELFGKTFFLCRPEVEIQEPGWTPCVAELPFEPLPTRLLHLMHRWSPAIDPLRSTPHRLVLTAEVLLLLVTALAVWQLLRSPLQLLQTGWEQYMAPTLSPRKEKLLQEELPKRYTLTQHAYLYKTAGGEVEAVQPLDACHDVTILEMTEASRERRNLFAHLEHLLLHRNESAVWGRVEDPAGWVVLVNEADNLRVIAAGEVPGSMPFGANAILLVPVPSLFRRLLVLAAAHASVQWFLLDRLAKMFQIAEIMVISFCVFAIHVVVLWQMEFTNVEALRFEQVLATEQKLLRLKAPRHATACLSIALVVLFAAFVAGILRRHADLTETLLCMVSLLTAIVLHVLDFRASAAGLDQWRSPQLQATEFTSFSSKGFQSVDDGPDAAGGDMSRGRNLRKHFVRWLCCALSSVGAIILVLIVLDGLQMRGELLAYGMNRGFLMTPPHSEAFTNTLLLHKSVDSLSFTFEAGPFTSLVKLRLEHPLMAPDHPAAQPVTIFDSAPEQGAQGGEYSLPLPAGPLYGRLIVEASSPLHPKPTQYVLHLLRITEAVTLSVQASINPSHFEERRAGKPAIFNEERRWLYQRGNPTWYVPDLDVRGDSNIRLRYLPVVLAPLMVFEREGGHQADINGMSMIAMNCHCGPEVPGFGNSCAVEERSMVHVLDFQVCIFQRIVKEKVVVAERPGSIPSNSSKLVQWLLDVNISGKSAVLQLNGLRASSSAVWPLQRPMEPQTEGSDLVITTTFETLIPTESLLTEVTQLALASTQDMTDAEMLAVPLSFVSHAPPIQLSIGVSHGFFLPEPLESEERNDFAACCLGDLTPVTAHIRDKRFMVAEAEISRGHGCDRQGIVKQKLFTAVRIRDQSCEPYCSLYRPRADTFDVSVTLSVARCFEQAIDLDDLAAFRNISQSMSTSRQAVFEACGTLQKAVQQNRTLIASEMLTSLGADPNGGSQGLETPLQVAAEAGNLPAMKLLLEEKATVDFNGPNNRTALFSAASNCQAQAVRYLLNWHSDPNQLALPDAGAK